MKSSIKLGKIAGIRVGLHYSWFIIAALIAFSLEGQFHQTNPSWGTTRIWIMALVTAVLFFVTLLLHELSHSLVAQAYGMKVTEITLFALGGVSQIESEPPDAKTEFWVAIAGPLASVAIGFGCLAAAAGLGWHRPAEPSTEATAVLVWLGYINSWSRGFQYDSRVSARWWPGPPRHHLGELPRMSTVPRASLRGLGSSSPSCSFSLEFGAFSEAPASTAFGWLSSAGF